MNNQVKFIGTEEQAESIGVNNDNKWIFDHIGFMKQPLIEYDGCAVVYYGDPVRIEDWDVFLIDVEFLQEIT